jgi:pilus assembly protein FimV
MDSIVLEQSMPHTKAALILMVAFTIPSAAEALGLGEIHVVSALNEPLVAEADIVGATAEDLAGISASIANPETFLRFGIDRPAFLSSAAFRITMNGRGQPVLAIRSTDAFTEPLINMLIDLRWHSGELIRQYTVLLDPAGFPSDTRVAEAAPAVGGPGAYTPPAAPETVRVAAGATLRGIVSRVGSRGDAGLERMMIAIYRGNAKAFEGNINRLRLGAVLQIPSFSEVSRITVADANHEVRLQMQTWRASPKLVNPVKPVGLAVAAAARQESTSNAPEGAIHALGNTAETSDDAALDRRIRRLEEGLHELQGALTRGQGTLAALQTRVALAGNTPAVTVVSPTTKSGHRIDASIAAVLVLASGVLGVLYLRRHSGAPHIAAQPAASREVTPAAPARNELPLHAQIEAQPRAKDEVRFADASADQRPIPRAAALDGIDVQWSDASYFSEASGDGLEHTVIDFDAANTADLASATMKTPAPDVNAETTPLEAVRIEDAPELSTREHSAPMPGILNEKEGFKERRTSLVDILKVAVKREPNRRDLRMKLLETYYAAAATSRQGFLEVAQSLAGERENMSDGEWRKIAGMGRQIAADHNLFGIGQADDKDLATCA